MIDKLLGAILGFGAASMLSKKDGNSFANGGEVGNVSTWEKNGFREYPKTSPQEWQLVEWSVNGHSPSFKGKLYFQSGTGLMFIEKSDGEIFKPKSSYKLFWREIQEYAKENVNSVKYSNGGGVLEYPFEYMGMRYNVTETSGMIDDGRRLYEIDIKDYGTTNLRAPNYDLAKKYAQIEVERIYDEENQFLKGGNVPNSKYEWAEGTILVLPRSRKEAEKRLEQAKLDFPEGRNFRIIEVPYSWGIDYRIIFEYERRVMSKGGLLKKYKDLKMGTDIEMEHKETIRKFKKKGMSDREVAMMIAKDHLEEDPDYYKKLKSLEDK